MACIAHRGRPLLLQGSLTTFRRRCGKPTCRCATGERHESAALRFTENGRTKTLTLTAAEVAQGTAAVGHYEQAKADLHARAAEGIDRLRGSRGWKWNSKIEAGSCCELASIFGRVHCERLAYRHRGHPNLYPADAAWIYQVSRTRTVCAAWPSSLRCSTRPSGVTLTIGAPG